MKNLVILIALFTVSAHAAMTYDEAVAKLKAKYSLIDKRTALKEHQKSERETLKAKQKAERDALKALKVGA